MNKEIVEKFEEAGVIAPAPKRNFTQQELQELQEMQRVTNSKKFEAIQIKNNTALIPRGQEVAEETEAVARLLENVKDQWVSMKLTECGFKQNEKVGINLQTGEITPVEESKKEEAV